MDGHRVKCRADNTLRISNIEIVQTKTGTFILNSGSFDEISSEVKENYSCKKICRCGLDLSNLTVLSTDNILRLEICS